VPQHPLESLWYRVSIWHIVLLPFSWLFAALAYLRRLFYRLGALKSTRLAVPVVVVGGISVGGSGKTPLVLWLARLLLENGYRPGIVSRGYRGSASAPCAVAADSQASVVGDEPVLLAQRSHCPVWVGGDRVAAAQALLALHPQVNVIIADDGLQHYRLQRDVEIVVLDGERGVGNGFLLPAGPLRESVARLRHVDAVVVNGKDSAPFAVGQAGYSMTLEGRLFHHLADRRETATAESFRGRTVHAVAGIGNPPRFFRHLEGLGLDITPHAFPDHHVYTLADLDFPGDAPILMTEKDAVKCEKLIPTRCWVLAVDAQLSAAFGVAILGKLHGHKTA
jgi:tetraacyldisaccharide 4'-kinase